MTEAEKKALAVFNAVREERGFPAKTGMNRHEYCHDEAFCRLSEQLEAERAAHAATKAEAEAFRREVSDAVEDYFNFLARNGTKVVLSESKAHFARFIIPKTDPLVEAMQEWWDADGYAYIDTFRTILAARGLKIVEDSHD